MTILDRILYILYLGYPQYIFKDLLIKLYNLWKNKTNNEKFNKFTIELIQKKEYNKNKQSSKVERRSFGGGIA